MAENPLSARRAPAPAGPWPVTRLLVSLGLIGVVVALEKIPCPGLDLAALGRLASFDGVGPMMSLGAVGVMPYLSAYLLVEVVHALWHWKRRRDLQPRDRRGLGKWVVGLTAVLAGWQAFGIAVYIESIQFPTGDSAVLTPGWGFRLLVMASLATASLLLVWLARLATRHGLGNGVALLMLYGLLAPLVRGAWHGQVGLAASQWDEIPAIPLVKLLAVGGVAALVVLMYRAERGHLSLAVPREGGPALRWPLKGNPAGLVPRHVVGWLLFVPYSIAPWLPDASWLNAHWHQGAWAFQLAYLALLPAAFWAYVRLTARPVRQAAMLERAGLGFDGALAQLQAAHRARWLRGLAYLLGLTAAVFLLERIGFGWFQSNLLGLFGLLWLLAILLDLKDETWFRRRHGALTLVGREHDMHAAKLVQAVLEDRGVPTMVQAYHARALDTFLGPYFELELWVPEARVDEARQVLVEIKAPLT